MSNQSQGKVTPMSVILSQWHTSSSFSSLQLDELQSACDSSGIQTVEQLQSMDQDAWKQMGLGIICRQKLANELQLLQADQAVPASDIDPFFFGPSKRKSNPASSNNALFSPTSTASSDMFGGQGEPFSPPLFTSIASPNTGHNDDPFTFASDDTSAFVDTDPLGVIQHTPSTTRKSVGRRKTQSLFDEAMLDGENGTDDPYSPAHNPVSDRTFSTASIDDEEIERVLAAFTPGDNDSLLALKLHASVDNDDEFDRLSSTTTSSSTRRHNNASSLFDDAPSSHNSYSGTSSSRSSSGSSNAPLEDRIQRVWMSDVEPIVSFDSIDSNPASALAASRNPSNNNPAATSAPASLRPCRLRFTANEIQILWEPTSSATGGTAAAGEVKKSFDFNDIFCVSFLESTSNVIPVPMAESAGKKQGVVSISFISDSDFSFHCFEAQIVSAELNERLMACKQSESMRSGGESAFATSAGRKHSAAHRSLFDGVVGFQEKMFAAQQQQQNSKSTSASAISNALFEDSTPLDTSIFFSPSYVSNAKSPAAKTPSNAASSTTTTPNNKSISSSATASTPGKSTATPVDPAYDAWHRQYVLDQSVQAVLDQFWLTPSSEESKARLKFLNSFPKLIANNQSQKKCTLQTFFIQIRQFLDSFKMYLEKKRMADMKKLLVPKYLAEPLFENTILQRIERTTEVAILVPLFKPLATLLNPNSHSSKSSFASVLFELVADDVKIAATMNNMKDVSQLRFGVDPAHVSPSNWNHAQKELLNLHQFELPADKIQVLLGTAKAIYQTFQYEQKLAAINKAKEQAQAEGVDATPLIDEAVKKSSKILLSGDAFMPIFTYVVSQSCIQSPSKLAFYMWQLCDPKALTGEAGYYLTVFDAALQYLKNGAPEPTGKKK